METSILRLGLLLILFDVYLTWVRVEKYLSNYALPPPPSSPSAFAVHFKSSIFGKLFTSQDSDPIKLQLGGSPLILQYLFFLILCAAETAGLHLSVRWGARYLLGYQRSLGFAATEKLMVGATSFPRRCLFRAQ